MMQPGQNRVDEIESWFRTHDDRQFIAPTPDHETVQFGNAANARTLVYTTKHHCLWRVQDLARLQEPVAVMGRCGLPVVEDLPGLGAPMLARLFIGDADPPDLLSFAWIREQVPILWGGVSDEFLVRHGTRELKWISVALSDSERATVPHLIRFCPDWRELLGEYCSSLLDAGCKIELEGATIGAKEVDR